MSTRSRKRSSKFIKQILQLVSQCSPEIILEAASRCDGHSILKPEAFTDAGLPTEVVEYLTRTYKSDTTPKGTIFVHGQAVKELSGVYGLDMLKFLALAMGMKYQSKIGRGSQAQAIQSALQRHFAPAQPAPAT